MGRKEDPINDRKDDRELAPTTVMKAPTEPATEVIDRSQEGSSRGLEHAPTQVAPAVTDSGAEISADTAGNADETRGAGTPTGVTPASAPSVPQAVNGVAKPKLAPGIELVGRYEGSGYKEDPYIARREDGQMIQLSQLLYLVAEAADGSRDLEAIAAQVTEGFGRNVSADNVAYLIENNLQPLGVLARPDGSAPEVQKADPLLALKLKKELLGERGVNAAAILLKPLFWFPVMMAFVAGLVAVDIWYFSSHGIGQSMRDLLYSPLLILGVYVLLILSILWHEFGHATACRYGGAKPGVIGFGIYVVWPAFYTDVTDTYRLGKGGRVRTDLGGVYFNGLFSIAIAGVYMLTRFEPLLVLILMQHMLMIYNFIPFLRMDGYYVISDLTGVPDLFSRVKPTLRSLIPGHETEDSVSELKTWVRVVVTLWVLIVIPLLLFLFAMMVLSAPRVLATGWDSFQRSSGKLSEAWGEGNYGQAAVDALQILFLVLPLLGMSITFSRIFKRIGAGAWGMTEGRPVLRTGFATLALACIAFAGYVLWPNGEYKPIQPGERWTLTEGVQAIADSTTGRPSLTEQRETELNGAPGIEEQEPTSDEPASTGTEEDITEEEEEQPQPVASPTTDEEPTPMTSPTPTPEASP
jgi:putative peptide zinc metalloprotease protein